MKGRGIVCALALLGALPLAATARIHFTAGLDGAQVGGGVTNGTGTGSFVRNAARTQWS